MQNRRERVVINTGPLIALERMGAIDLPGKMDVEFITSKEVIVELEAGMQQGYSALNPPWLQTKELKSPVSPMVLSLLDLGEASVIQLAIEQSIPQVCIDEMKGRRIATASGLKVTGALGLLGRAKEHGIIRMVKPYIDQATNNGVHYHPDLIRRFITALKE